MKATIDKAGRVVIPKAIRDRAGLRPGMELEISFDGGRIELDAPAPQGRIVYEDGLPYWKAAPNTPPIMPEEINEIIREIREERYKP
jgi:AbrB family looped-hinge helix DNA binding protein